MLLKKKTILFAIIFFVLTLVFTMEALFTKHLNYTLPFVGYGGTFKFHNFLFCGLSLYIYAYIVGVIGMILMCIYRKDKYNISYIISIITAVLLALFGCLGAKVLYIIENYDYVANNGISFGGMSFFGTVLLMPIVISILGLCFKKKPCEFLDYCTPAGLVMLASVRFGCFLKGCCAGITFWVSERPVTVPVQLIECTFDVLLLAFIFDIENKEKYKGKLYFIFMGCYGLYRFFLELLRNTPKDILIFSHGQCFSILCIIISIAALSFNGVSTKTSPSSAGGGSGM